MNLIRVLLLCMLCFSCSTNQKKTLYLFTWSEFFNPALIAEFEKEFNCRVIIDTYDSNESMYAKLKLGATGYDIVFPSNYYLDILHKQNMILPFDSSAVSNISHLDSRYVDKEYLQWGVPFIVSYSGIAYRQDRLHSLEPSWGVFARNDLKGRMTMLNDIRETIGASLKYLGYSINTRNPEELEEAGDQLLIWKNNLAKFESEQYKNGIATAEFLVVQGYSIDIMQIRQEDKNVAFLFPNEGSIMSIDYMALPKGARNVELAYQFINFMLEPKNVAVNMSYSSSLIPVLPAYQLLQPDLKNSKILFPENEVLEKMELIEDVQGDIKLYYKVWERVKAGSL